MNNQDKIVTTVPMRGRFYWMDLTRIFACFAVIVIHVAGASNTANNVINTCCHCAVPLFVMISGANFLEKDIDIKTIWKKYIFPLFITFLIWSFIYAVYTSYTYYYQFDSNVLFGDNKFGFIKTVLINTINGHYHMWYIWMTIGLYSITFFVRKMVDSCTEKQLFYFISVSFIYLSLVYITQYSVFTNFLSMITDIRLNFVMGFIIYYVGGYYINRKQKSNRINIYMLVIGIIGLVGNIAFILLRIEQKGNCYFFPFTIMVAFSFFWFLSKYTEGFASKHKAIIYEYSKLTLPIYLAHDFGIIIFKSVFGISDVATWLVIPLTLLIFVFCYGISKLLSLNKHTAKLFCNIKK